MNKYDNVQTAEEAKEIVDLVFNNFRDYYNFMFYSKLPLMENRFKEIFDLRLECPKAYVKRRNDNGYYPVYEAKQKTNIFTYKNMRRNCYVPEDEIREMESKIYVKKTYKGLIYRNGAFVKIYDVETFSDSQNQNRLEKFDEKIIKYPYFVIKNPQEMAKQLNIQPDEVKKAMVGYVEKGMNEGFRYQKHPSMYQYVVDVRKIEQNTSIQIKEYQRRRIECLTASDVKAFYASGYKNKNMITKEILKRFKLNCYYVRSASFYSEFKLENQLVFQTTFSIEHYYEVIKDMSGSYQLNKIPANKNMIVVTLNNFNHFRQYIKNNYRTRYIRVIGTVENEDIKAILFEGAKTEKCREVFQEFNENYQTQQRLYEEMFDESFLLEPKKDKKENEKDAKNQRNLFVRWLMKQKELKNLTATPQCIQTLLESKLVKEEISNEDVLELNNRIKKNQYYVKKFSVLSTSKEKSNVEIIFHFSGESEMDLIIELVVNEKYTGTMMLKMKMVVCKF